MCIEFVDHLLFGNRAGEPLDEATGLVAAPKEQTTVHCCCQDTRGVTWTAHYVPEGTLGKVKADGDIV